MNYHLLSRAISHYEKLGYKFIEVPWVVSREADCATKPEDKDPISVWIGDAANGQNNHYVGNLVASGEQSFIEMMLRGELPPGKYMTVTPCFRNDQLDELHYFSFLKLELIDTETPSLSGQVQMILDASYLFWDLGIRTKMERTGEFQFDICGKKTGIELGSYGYRTYKNFSWAYGTGLSEPRTSQVIRKEKEDE